MDHRPDSLRTEGTFFTISWAARRISTPWSCGSAPARAPESWRTPLRKWPAGTTSSLALDGRRCSRLRERDGANGVLARGTACEAAHEAGTIKVRRVLRSHACIMIAMGEY